MNVQNKQAKLGNSVFLKQITKIISIPEFFSRRSLNSAFKKVLVNLSFLFRSFMNTLIKVVNDCNLL